MRNTIKLTAICLFVFAALVVAGYAFASPQNIENSTVTVAETVPSGRQVYLNSCAKCHGSDGRGMTPKGEELEVPDLTGGRAARKTIAKITSIVRNGKGDMPGYKNKLTAAKIGSVVAYVRTL